MPYYKVSFAVTSVEIVSKLVEAQDEDEAEDKACNLMDEDNYYDSSEVEIDDIEETDQKPYVKPDPNQKIISWERPS